MTRFRATVEPHEPMRGLEVPAEAVAALGPDKRPRVVVTVNGHSWSTRVALMRGRALIGLSNAHRSATGVQMGDEVDVELVLDTAPIVATEPPELREVLDANLAARAAFEARTPSQRRQHVRMIEQAKTSQTRLRRAHALVTDLLAAADQESKPSPNRSSVRSNRLRSP